MSHPNLVLQDYDASVAHFHTLFGAETLLDLPRPEWRACLLDIGGMIFELFVPPNFLLNSRIGAHYLGIEYEVDMEEAREAIAAHGLRIIRDLGVALHTDPADGFGVAFEFYGGSFYGDGQTGLTRPVKSEAYWRDEHPIGLAGMKAWTLAVGDVEAASRFLQSFLSAEPVYEAERPALGARAVGLKVADATIEVLAPDGDGPLARELQRTGQGMRSVVLRTRDLEQARRYFVSRGTPLIPGALPGSFAVAPSANLGVLFEFAE